MASNSSTVDREVLVRKAYSSENELLIRQRTHELYSVPRVDFAHWVLSHHAWRGDERVLDIGCGPGLYFDHVHELTPAGEHYASDFSAGMIRKAKTHPVAGSIHFLMSDAQALPFPNQFFDVVLANHMLFHVKKVEIAIREIHRVLKPDGILIAATNSQFSMAEFNTLTRRALTLLGHPPSDDRNEFSQLFTSFSLENGAMKLADRFRSVVRHDIPGALVFREAQPVLDYINSTRSMREPGLPQGVEWNDFMMVMSQQVQRLIKHFGELTVYKLSGVLMATDCGGFARSFTEKLLRRQS